MDLAELSDAELERQSRAEQEIAHEARVRRRLIDEEIMRRRGETPRQRHGDVLLIQPTPKHRRLAKALWGDRGRPPGWLGG